MPRSYLSCLGLIGILVASIADYSQAAETPRKIGLAGAGRSGILQEALYTNPAALAYLQQSLAFGYYGMPRITDWNAGGRQVSVGAYDGDNPFAKAGLAYERDSRAILLAGGARGYRDRSTYLLGVGRQIFDMLDLGVTGKYVVRRDGGDTTKFFDGNAGALIKAIPSLQLGVTYENFANREGETPPILGMGIRYDILGPIAALVDGGYSTKGVTKSRKQWSYAMELGLADDVIARGGFFQDSINGHTGRALGISWQGPRTSFDYGLRMTRKAPVQREHVFGMTVQL